MAFPVQVSHIFSYHSLIKTLVPTIFLQYLVTIVILFLLSLINTCKAEHINENIGVGTFNAFNCAATV